MKLLINNIEEIQQAASKVVEQSKDRKVWLFNGEMGAGKTTLIKAVCQELEVEDEVSSPTFSIVNEYVCHSGEVVYHFDFYRLESVEQAMDIGMEEYLYSGNICLIEWPSVLAEILPDEAYRIDIVVKDNYLRELDLS